MTVKELLRRSGGKKHAHDGLSTELTEAELREYEAAAEQRYRAMTFMDQPLHERAAFARKITRQATPLGDKTW